MLPKKRMHLVVLCALYTSGCGHNPTQPSPPTNVNQRKPEPYAVAKTFLDALQAHDNNALQGLMTVGFLARIADSHKGFTTRAALLNTGNGAPDAAFVADSWTITEDGTDQVWSDQVTTWRVAGTGKLNSTPHQFTMLLEKQKNTGGWRVESFIFH